MEKIKTIAKYVVNTLNILNALILGINSVEGITIPYTHQISGVILVICGVLSTYLLGNKVVMETKKVEEPKTTEEIEVL